MAFSYVDTPGFKDAINSGKPLKPATQFTINCLGAGEQVGTVMAINAAGIATACTVVTWTDTLLTLIAPPNIVEGVGYRVEVTLYGENIPAYYGETKADTFADLRTIEPTIENQVITLIGHTVAGIGGGTFRAVLDGSGLTDDNINTAITNNGSGWVALNYNELSFYNYVDRNPNTDDSNYKEDGYWVNDNSVYKFNGGESARWNMVTGYNSSIESAKSGIKGCWWLKKVISGYSGFCINVTNEDTTTTQDIGFDYKGDLDEIALFSLLKSSRGLINTVYDQSGNGFDLTALTVNRPIISRSKNLNDMFTIIFETSVISNGSENPQQFLTIPTALTLNSDSLSACILSRCANSVNDNPMLLLQGVNNVGFGTRRQNTVDSLVVYMNNSLRVNSGIKPQNNPYFASFSIGASVDIYAMDSDTATGTKAAGVTALAGGMVGGADALFLTGGGAPIYGGSEIAGLTIYDSAMTQSEHADLLVSTCLKSGTKTQINGNLVFDGDSITEGADASQFNNWPRLVENLNIRPSKFFNVAKSGGTTATQIASISKWDSKVFDSTAPYNIVNIFMGTNDLGAGATGAAIYSNLETYIADVVSSGYDFILYTTLPRSSFIDNSKETERQAYNALIRENWMSLGALTLVDFDEEGFIGLESTVQNAAYYSDGTHPTDLGYSIISGYAAPKINGAIKRLV